MRATGCGWQQLLAFCMAMMVVVMPVMDVEACLANSYRAAAVFQVKKSGDSLPPLQCSSAITHHLTHIVQKKCRGVGVVPLASDGWEMG